MAPASGRPGAGGGESSRTVGARFVPALGEFLPSAQGGAASAAPAAGWEKGEDGGDRRRDGMLTRLDSADPWRNVFGCFVAGDCGAGGLNRIEGCAPGKAGRVR